MTKEPWTYPTTEAPPEMGEKGGALITKGFTMGPICNDSLCFFDHNETPPREELFGKLCICADIEGRRYVRILQPGSKPGLYTMQSVTGDPIEDVPLLWAEKVKWVKLP